MKTYITNNLPLAATLHILGGNHLQTELGYRHTAYFVFKATAELENQIRDYYQGKVSIVPQELADAEKYLFKNVQGTGEIF